MWRANPRSVKTRKSRPLGALVVLPLCLTMLCIAQQSPPRPAAKLTPQEGDYVSRDFHFKSGETLPELRLHYMSLGKP